MNRVEGLKIGKIIADRWWHHSQSTILAQQNIEQNKLWTKKGSLRRPAEVSN